MDNQPPSISRVTCSKQAARASYDRLSRWYDLFSGASEKAFIDLGITKLAVRPGETILEIGQGTGQGLMQLSQAVGTSGKVYGVDLSGRMCQQAQARLLTAGMSARSLPICGDAVYLPFAPATIDAIFTAFTLELFDTPEIPLVLAACWRVLRPGGRLGVVVMVKSEGEPSWMLRVYEWMHARLPTLVDCRPIYASEAVTDSGFNIAYSNTRLMWGLPVNILVGIKR